MYSNNKPRRGINRQLMLYTNQIEKQTRGVKFFIGVYPCDKLPSDIQKPATLIINTDPAREEGEHWVAVHLRPNGLADYFCSLGFPPLVPEIQHFLSIHGHAGKRYNRCTIQDLNTSLCGDFCICFVKCVAKGVFLPEFVRRFSTDLEKNKTHLLCIDKLSS